jgi:hypothetical protein
MAPEADQDDEIAASLADALLVYAEPLAANAHAVVIGDAESSIAERLIELGARSVYVFDPDPARAAAAARNVPRGVLVRPFVDELDVRDGTFDLAVIPDLADVNDPRGAVARLRNALAANGSLVALCRARTSTDESLIPPFEQDLGPAALTYDELYEVFSSEFEEIALAGVLPFTGIVFAALGREEDPAVSVETRLAQQDAPSVFVVVASSSKVELDPYAIVQVDEPSEEDRREDALALETAIAAATLKGDMLSTQVEELKDRVVVADVRAVETAARLDRATAERDAALTRAMELEAVLGAAQSSLATIERTLLEAERGMLERDDRIAQLSAELDSRESARGGMTDLAARADRAEAALALVQEELAQRAASQPTDVEVRIEDVAALLERAERAETELAALFDAHTAETAAFESQLQDRARLVAQLERELVRREELVRELVTSMDEATDGANTQIFEAVAPLPVADNGPLKAKLDELANDVARREGELTARGWRIKELERALDTAKAHVPPPRVIEKIVEKAAPPPMVPKALQDELDALRQALAQEHAARVAAESGEELTQARAELARQAALLEQIRAQRETS